MTINQNIFLAKTGNKQNFPSKEETWVKDREAATDENLLTLPEPRFTRGSTAVNLRIALWFSGDVQIYICRLFVSVTPRH